MSQAVTSSAKAAKVVTPHDTETFAVQYGPTYAVARGLHVGVEGNIKVLTADNDNVSFIAVPVGFFPVHVRQVYATGTTASSIIALY